MKVTRQAPAISHDTPLSDLIGRLHYKMQTLYNLFPKQHLSISRPTLLLKGVLTPQGVMGGQCKLISLAIGEQGLGIRGGSFRDDVLFRNDAQRHSF